MEKIKVGISQCLLGDEVRFNGGHKHSRYCTSVLAEYFDFLSVCPEVESGMPIPRPPIRLVDKDNQIKVLQVDDNSIDFTDSMNGYSKDRVQQSDFDQLDGFILMQKSPSCGMERVKVYHENGNPLDNAAGVFANQLMKQRPNLPVEEEGRLHDPLLRENFFVRVYCHNDFRRFRQSPITAKGLIEFHSRYKYLLMAHDLEAYKELGRMLANLADKDLDAISTDYFGQLMSALKRLASRKSHTNVMQHLQGYLKRHLNSTAKQELVEVIDQYREGIVPLIVPLMLLRHHMTQHPEDCEYALNQVYLQPHPYKLGLRNQI